MIKVFDPYAISVHEPLFGNATFDHDTPAVVLFDATFVPSTEDKILLLLKQYAYEELFDRSLESVGFLNVASGMIICYEVTSTIREQLSHMWQHLQRKYNLYQE